MQNFLKDFAHRTKVLTRQRHYYLSYLYSFFLVFVTPLAIPIAIWTIYAGVVTTTDLVVAFILYCLSGLGISVGYHRLVTHRSFQTPNIVKRLILICGSFAMQGGPAPWASLHIQHHRFADKPGDPHSPKVDGFWQAHCGWIFHDYQPDFRRYGKWLLDDKDVRHVTKYYLLYSNLSLLIPFLIGGWVGLIWGGFVRLFVCSHTTWAVNSVCHRWGSRLYPKTPDTSTNNPIVALLTFGEGWHNNHHRYMQMPFFGHKWYQIDFGKWLILGLKSVGLAWDLKIPKAARGGNNPPDAPPVEAESI